jgi:aminoglycoside phosphotransferase (APT) family kinase protein
MTDPLRRRPPERTLRWAIESIGPESRLTSLRRLTPGGWHANHAVTIVDRSGAAHRLVLRRWARPEWAEEDPEFTAEREAAMLDMLSGTPVPAPQLIAADTEGVECDVPTLLLERLDGGPPGLPGDMSGFLAQLVEALTTIHTVDGGARDTIGGFRTFYDLGSLDPPAWSERPALWERALHTARAEPPPEPRCFIHRDYHPENTLWWRGRLTGVVDWTSACWGPPGIDVGHMRWNLAVTYGVDAAEEFLRLSRATAGGLDDQRYWDAVAVADVLPEITPDKWSAFDLARFDRYMESILRGKARGESVHARR